ncbi:MAG: protein kinase domain-containing protein [Limisphaerales bacterium]
MDTTQICSICGKPVVPGAPQGLCPECLMKSGFETKAGNEPAAGKPAFVPPSVEQMARLFPQLEIIELLGQGGMGAVFKARQPRLNRFVALKILSPEKQSDPQFAERFEREARALAWLSHPNIVTVYDFGETQGNYFLLMEFVDGMTLRKLLQARRLASAEALAIVPQICQALQYAHEQGVIHRDIKPENILLDKKGQVKIADFGIAKLLDQAPQDISLTGAKDVVGTPYYMAPEQIEKPQTVDSRADIYSLGVVFYEMLTGELPLGNFPPPSQKVQIDVRLDEVVLRAMEKEPERRYQTASQVKTALETIANTIPPPANAEMSAGEILAGDYTLDIGRCLQRGWVLVRGDFWPVVGVTALVRLLQIAALSACIGLVFLAPLMGGLCLYFLKKIRGEPAGAGTAFSGFSRAFLPLFLASLVMALLTTAGFFCLILPGIYLMVGWTFTLVLVIDKRLGFWPAMRLSRKTVSKHWWKVFGFIIVLSLIKMAGMLVFVVGSLLTAPVALAALMYAYEDIFGTKEKPAGIPATVPLVAATGTSSGWGKAVFVGGLGIVALILLFCVATLFLEKRHEPAGLPRQGLVALWPGEGNGNDVMGTNNGVAQTIAYTDGVVGQAFVLNGSGSSYIRIPARPSLDVGQSNGFTLELWCNPATTNFSSNPMTLVEWNNNSGALTGIGCHLEFYNGGVILGDIVDPTTGKDYFVQSPGGDVVPNTWQHVAMTYDKTTGVLALYRNGVMLTNRNVGSWTPSTAFDLYFGIRKAGVFAPIPYQGLLDEISLYNRALTAGEIKTCYDAVRKSKNPQPEQPIPTIAASAPVSSNIVVNPNPFELHKKAREPAGHPRQALVALWSGEGNGNDSMGNNAAILTDVAFAEGKVGRAFSLNGYSSYAKVPFNPSLDMESRDGLTLSLWIKPLDVSGFHPILEWYSSTTQPLGIGSQLRLGQNARSRGVLEAVIVDMDGHYHVLRSPPDTVVANSFQHVAVTYDQASGTGILYLNGRVVAQSRWRSFPPKTKGDLWISYRPFSHPGDFTYHTFFAGLLDEIAIFNRALTTSEIQTYYNAVMTGGNLQPYSPAPAMAVSPFVNPGALGNLLNEDQRLVEQYTERKFHSFFDERTFDGWSNNERAGLERRLIDALKGPRSDEYYQAINSLAALSSVNALPTLREIAFDRREKDNRDRWMSARALGLLGDKQSVPEMIHLLYHYNSTVRWWAQISLVRLTGQNFGGDWQAWGKWWNSQNNQPPFKLEIVRWSKTQVEPDQLAENIAESDRSFLANIQGRGSSTNDKPPGPNNETDQKPEDAFPAQ